MDDFIGIKGAREHNLQGTDVNIPKYSFKLQKRIYRASKCNDIKKMQSSEVIYI
jgi:excinuclease UvrABC ATPase subunit